MGSRSKIEWTESSWTPIRTRNRETGKVGWHCEHASPGCELCYAESLNRVYGTQLPFKPGHRKDVELFVDEKMLTAPLRWRRPRMVFVCSMTDLFADFTKDEWIDKVFAVMALFPQHTFQCLTKRPDRMRTYVNDWFSHLGTSEAIINHPNGARRVGDFFDWEMMPAVLFNLWLGISAEDQARADERIPDLLATPAAIRFVSYEPALEPVDFTAYPAVDWIIVGGESGPKARPFNVAWARSVVRQCLGTETACFVKQLGAFVLDRNDAGFDGCEPTAWPEHIESEDRIDYDPFGYIDEAQGAPARIRLRDRKGADIEEFPPDLRVREFPTGASG